MFRRTLRMALLAPALALVAGCGDDPATPRPEPTFTRMIVSVTPSGAAPYTVEVTRATSTASRTFTFPSGTSALSVRYLNADGSEDQVLQNFVQEYESRIAFTTQDAATIARGSKHSFVVTRVAAGTTTAVVQLWDLGTRRARVEVNVPVTVQ